MRSLFALDVLLAAYAGLMIGPAILLSRWFGATFGGVDGLVTLYSTEHYGILLLASACGFWSMSHFMLMVPSLLVAIGLRMKRPWASGLGRIVGVLLLMLPPFGSLIGVIVLFRFAGRNDMTEG